MSDNPFDETPPGERSVNVTLKAGKGYDAPWLTLRAGSVADALAYFTDDGTALADLLLQVSGASAAFMNEYDRKNGGLPPSRTYGKPEGANTPAVAPPADDSVPFGDSSAGNEQPTMGCPHGKRTMVTHNGKTGHVCPLPKGNPNRCETLFA